MPSTEDIQSACATLQRIYAEYQTYSRHVDIDEQEHTSSKATVELVEEGYVASYSSDFADISRCASTILGQFVLQQLKALFNLTHSLENGDYVEPGES